MSEVKFQPSGAHHVRLPLVLVHLDGGQYRHKVFECYALENMFFGLGKWTVWPSSNNKNSFQAINFPEIIQE